MDVAARFAPARELGGDLYDFLAPEPNSLVVAVGDVSGKGVPAALYSAFAGELIRSRTFRRRYAPERFSPAGVLASTNTILHERQLEEYYCTLCYARLRLQAPHDDAGEFRPAVSDPLQRRDTVGADRAARRAARVVRRARPTTSCRFDLARGDVFVFCTDGVFEANDALGREFGAERLLQVVNETRTKTAREIVDAIFAAVQEFRGDTPPNDDMTAVALKMLT